VTTSCCTHTPSHIVAGLRVGPARIPLEAPPFVISSDVLRGAVKEEVGTPPPPATSVDLVGLSVARGVAEVVDVMVAVTGHANTSALLRSACAALPALTRNPASRARCSPLTARRWFSGEHPRSRGLHGGVLTLSDSTDGNAEVTTRTGIAGTLVAVAAAVHMQDARGYKRRRARAIFPDHRRTPRTRPYRAGKASRPKLPSRRKEGRTLQETAYEFS